MLFQKAFVCTHVDGDTVVVKLDNGTKERVRFIGVNCPEWTLRHEPYGKEASEYTKGKLLSKTVYLEKDTRDRDIFGRLLRYIWLEVPKGFSEGEIRCKMFNAALLVNGYAAMATYYPDVKYRNYFRKLENEARKEEKGMWSINYYNIWKLYQYYS